MAKDKTKTAKGIPNKHLHARISFLQQAAVYMAEHQTRTQAGHVSVVEDCKATVTRADASCGEKSAAVAEGLRPALWSGPMPTKARQTHAMTGLSIQLSTQVRQVAHKSQIRLHPSVKHMSCKTCQAVLLEGETCEKYIENLSQSGQKPHADMLVRECTSCGTKRRFPINATRQLRKSKRVDRCAAKAVLQKP